MRSLYRMHLIDIAEIYFLIIQISGKLKIYGRHQLTISFVDMGNGLFKCRFSD